VHFYVLETVPSKTDPQMADCIMGEKKMVEPAFVCLYSRNKEFYSCLSEREVYMMCSHFPVNTLIKSQYFQNMNLMIAEIVNICNIT
jgi:hypothetical protein